MTQIKKMHRMSDGVQVYPQTHTKAVIDDNGYTAESRLQAMQNEINSAQLDINAVASDLAPVEESNNYVTSDGLYKQLNFGGSNVVIDLSEYTEYQAFPNPSKWVTNNSSYLFYGVFVPITPGKRYRLKGNTANNSYYGFLTTDSHTNNATVSYATGCTRVTLLPNTVVITDYAPSNAKFLYVRTRNGDTDNAPQSVEEYNKRSVSDILQDVDLSPELNSEKIVTSDGIYRFDPIHYENVEISSASGTIINYYTNTSKWTSGRSIVIPCSYGDTFELICAKSTSSSDGAWYAWLTSSFVPPTSATASSTPPYVSGTTRAWLQISSEESEKELSLTAPKGAAYLCLSTTAVDNYASWRGAAVQAKKLIDLIKENTPLSYTDNMRTELEEEIEFKKYSSVEYPDIWSTYTSAYITYERDENDIVVTIVNSSSNRRCGFDISNLAVGERIYVEFTSTRGIVFGVGETLASTYINVGTYTRPFYFTKTSSSQNYLYIPASSYSTGTVLRLVGFKVYKVRDLELIEEKLDSIDAYAFMPSSYIPIKEKYETYMSISGTQGSTIYGNYFVQGFSENAKISIYDLETKTKVQDVTLPAFGNTRFHANTISFSGTKYDSGDDFPLLYICAGYVNTSNPTVSEVYVVRIVGESGSYTSELVQTINLAFGRWTEFTCDPVRNRAWINGSGIARYICVAIPDTSESEVTIDANTAIIDKFDTKKFLLGTTTNSSNQGRFFYHNRVYYVSGVPSNSGEGVEALYIVVDNVLTHCTEAVVPLMNFGLTGEPEGCFIWKDEFYVAYRKSIVKLIQN